MQTQLFRFSIALAFMMLLGGVFATPLDAQPRAQGEVSTPTPDPLDPYAHQLTPTPQPAGTPPHVGVQIGHWKASEMPDELARFRTSTGTRYGSLTEAAFNLSIGQRVVALLQNAGVVVDLLPATVPISYTADAFVTIHADGSSGGVARGFKMATPWRTSRASQHLLDSLVAEYRPVGLPQDGNVTINMRGYYAFNNRRFQHAITRATPAVIIETGSLTNAADRAVLINQPDRVARAITNGLLRYLRERDPNDGQALLPPVYPVVHPASDGVTIRATPSDRARAIAQVNADRRLFIFSERDGWFQVFVRGQGNTVGWVRRDQVVATNEPDVPPVQPSGDS